MPKTVRVNGAPQGREVEQLEAHRHRDPRDGAAGQERPRAAALAPADVAEPGPDGVLEDADGHVGRHVVGVVPAPELEVDDVGGVEGAAGGGPGAQVGPARAPGVVQAARPHHDVVESVEDAGAGGEVVELLGEAEVARVEHGAEDPGRDAHEGEDLVVAPHRVPGRDLAPHLEQAPVVRRQVAQAEEHRERLLHPQHPGEGPLPVELRHGLAGGAPPRRHDLLAGVVAFFGARPEEEAAVDRC